MTILEKIFAWSKEIPPWQSDALRRLFAQRALADSDYADLVALAKQHNGIPDTEKRTPLLLSREHVPVSDLGGPPVVLHALRGLKNVNALVDSQELIFAERGVTVFYGDNGTGKSGYARVMKRACRARDDEQVLPNASIPQRQRGVPEATLIVSRGSEKKEEQWIDGQASPELLSALSVFDGRCARVYLDEESDIAYKPYGLDLVEDLGNACVRVRESIQHENKFINLDLSVFDDLKGPTKVGALIAGLSARTNPETIRTLTTIRDEERKRMEELDKLLKEGNPLDKAKGLRGTTSRLIRLADSSDNVERDLSDTVITNLRGIDEAFISAQKASEFVTNSLREDAAALPGTGSVAWRDLLNAAHRYSKEAYPEHPFPHIGTGAKCVLCQQDLTDDGRNRYRKFGEFLSSVAEKEFGKAKEKLLAAESATKRLNVPLPMDDELLETIKDLEEPLAQTCQAFRNSLTQRHEGLHKAFTDHSWASLPPLSASPSLALRQHAERLNADAKALENSANKEVREGLLQEQRELRAREQLVPRKDAILRALGQLQYKTKLTECAASIDTSGISRKARALTQEAVSEALATALNRDFSSLGVDHLKVTFSTRVERGRTLQQLKLDFPGSSEIARVLSEGEQRALALASFLAEISLAPGSSGLIFDDPVSSLDHLRRERVASRLVSEGAKRQIIVFTHDLFFLGLLTNEAATQQVPILCQSIERRGENIGVLSPTLPFAGQSTKQRIGHLKQRILDVMTVKRAGEHAASEALIKDGYDLLRQAWERAIEEVLLQGVVERFERGIHTQKLSGVKVEDEDWVEVNNAMTRCSQFTGHDRPRTGGTLVLDLAAFETDVLALESFQKRIVTRTEGLRTARRR